MRVLNNVVLCVGANDIPLDKRESWVSVRGVVERLTTERSTSFSAGCGCVESEEADPQGSTHSPSPVHGL